MAERRQTAGGRGFDPLLLLHLDVAHSGRASDLDSECSGFESRHQNARQEHRPPKPVRASGPKYRVPGLPCGGGPRPAAVRGQGATIAAALALGQGPGGWVRRRRAGPGAHAPRAPPGWPWSPLPRPSSRGHGMGGSGPTHFLQWVAKFRFWQFRPKLTPDMQ